MASVAVATRLRPSTSSAGTQKAFARLTPCVYTEASVLFVVCDREIGVTRKEGLIEYARLEAAVRTVLEKDAPRLLAVLNPLKVTLTNVAPDETVWVEAPNFPGVCEEL